MYIVDDVRNLVGTNPEYNIDCYHLICNNIDIWRIGAHMQNEQHLHNDYWR